MTDSTTGNPTRPDVMDSLTESQLSELENQFDENDRDEFNTFATSFGWNADTCQKVWDWLSIGKRNEGFEGKQR